MEWGDREMRIAVVALHKCDMKPGGIFETLKKLGVCRRFVYRTIKLYNETNDVKDRKRSGRPRTVREPNAINAVKIRIDRNPLCKQEIMAQEMNISSRTMSRIIKSDLGLGTYKRCTGQFLTTALKKKRAIKSKQLLARFTHEEYRNILFTDEKMFTIEVEEATSSRKACQLIESVQRDHYTSTVMVWWGVSYAGVTDIHFCEKDVKTTAKIYQKNVLEQMVKPLNITLFQNKHWVLQQDSAQAHIANSTQAWLVKNVPEFIMKDEWPSSSPDLNPLDYKLWSILESMTCSRRHTNIESLKKSLVEAVTNFPMYEVCAAIDAWPDRLKACVNAKGDYFE